jgi:hypothetical protein
VVHFFPLFQVVFSDETTFQIGLHRVGLVRRRPGDPLRQLHMQKNKTYARKVMFWGFISSKGPGRLIPIHGTLNVARYVNLLHDELIPQAIQWYGQCP